MPSNINNNIIYVYYKIKKILIIGIVFSLVFNCIGCTILHKQELVWFTPFPTHKIFEQNGLNMVWVRDSVFIRDDHLQSLMTSNNGGVYFLGGINQNDDSAITALDVSDGDLLWQIGRGYRSVIISNSDALYVGKSGGATIIKYELTTGSDDWEVLLPDTRGLVNLLIVSDELFARTTPDKFFIINAESGKIIEQMKGSNIFISNETVTYQGSYISSVLDAVSTNTHNLIWEINVHDTFLMVPVFTDNLIFIRTDIGGIYCIDRQTGKILWNTQNIAISNIINVQGMIYFLSRNGELIGLNDKTGDQEISIQFDETRFVLNGEAHIGGYYVTYNQQNGLLFAYTGDSAQLFAFQK